MRCLFSGARGSLGQTGPYTQPGVGSGEAVSLLWALGEPWRLGNIFPMICKMPKHHNKKACLIKTQMVKKKSKPEINLYCGTLPGN